MDIDPLFATPRSTDEEGSLASLMVLTSMSFRYRAIASSPDLTIQNAAEYNAYQNASRKRSEGPKPRRWKIS